MIKAIVIDDEKNSREYIETVLQDYCPDVEVIASADSAATGIEAIKEHGPDLIFLDIQMPGGDGFDLLEKFPQPSFDVIFITAYDQYAVKAFKFSALDYLLKPIDSDELVAAVSKVRQKDSGNLSQNTIHTLLENLNPNNMYNKIALSTSAGMIFVRVIDIIRCQADGNYTNFFFTNGNKLMISKSIKEYEGLFSDNNFVRIHKTHLVNLNHVESYHKDEGGYVIMVDKARLEISRRKKDEFLEKISNY